MYTSLSFLFFIQGIMYEYKPSAWHPRGYHEVYENAVFIDLYNKSIREKGLGDSGGTEMGMGANGKLRGDRNRERQERQDVMERENTEERERQKDRHRDR